MAANRSCTTGGAAARSTSAQQSPTTRNTSSPSTTVADNEANGSTPGDIGILAEHLRVLKLTVGALGCALDGISEQTASIANTAPTLSALHEIGALRERFEQKQKVQQERMQDAQAMLKEETKRQVRGRLAQEVDMIVKEIVRREIAQRVRDQLVAHIPHTLHEEVHKNRLEVLNVKTNLHNSEARRQNALIRSSSLHEPLHPLLRPLEGAIASGTEPIGIPQASSLFPQDVTSLIKLPTDSLKALLHDYGLRKSDTAGTATSREQYLNEFMSFIGVGFQLVPSSAGGNQDEPQLQSPLITRASSMYTQ